LHDCEQAERTKAGVNWRSLNEQYLDSTGLLSFRYFVTRFFLGVGSILDVIADCGLVWMYPNVYAFISGEIGVSMLSVARI
jgi:hypothetical protein